MSNNSKDKDFAPINVEISDRIPMSSQRQSSGTSTKVITKSNNGLVSLLMLISLTACGACGYLYWLHQQHVQTLNANEARILSLESKLSATGEEIGNSTVALQVKVTELSNRSEQLWEQMDKLWASAWRRNQQEIKAIEAGLGNFKKDVNTLIKQTETQVSTSADRIQQLQKRIDGVNGKVTTQSNDILGVNVEQEKIQSSLGKQSTELRQMAEKLILLEKRNTTLLQKLQQLEAKLNEVVSRSV